MIISHKHKFIFIKTRKTAGTSIEIYLEKLCGKNDIVTPIMGAQSDNGSHRERNSEGFYNHMSAAEIKQKIEPGVWNDYYKFSFDRNPWDKQVSMYYWRKHQSDFSDSFEEFCIKGDGHNTGAYLFPSDYKKYTIDMCLAVDFLGRYESLYQDMKKISQELGLPFEDKLPYAKSKHRVNKGSYVDLYTDETIALVEKNYSDEIEKFKYVF